MAEREWFRERRAAEASEPPARMLAPVLPFSTDDLGYVLVAALRYQLPRQTYGSYVVAKAVRAALPLLTAGDRAVLARDLREGLADPHGAGAGCDRAQWTQLLASVEAVG